MRIKPGDTVIVNNLMFGLVLKMVGLPQNGNFDGENGGITPMICDKPLVDTDRDSTRL